MRCLITVRDEQGRLRSVTFGDIFGGPYKETLYVAGEVLCKDGETLTIEALYERKDWEK